jgi:ketosteroid isomerase-like protein
MNDMQANLERLKSLVGPGAAGKHPDAAETFIALYADDVQLRWQGDDWPWGGGMVGKDKLVACMQATASLFIEPPEFWHSEFWILDDERLLWWWRSRSRTFHDEDFSNSGVTILRYRDDSICEHWEYTDTQHLTHMLTGWRDQVDVVVGRELANWRRPT